MNVNKLINLKKPLNFWCLREMRVSLQHHMGRLFGKVKFAECKVRDIHLV